MKKSKLEAARSLAKAHFAVEPNLKRVCLIEPLDSEDPREPIKLLEVVEGTIERGIEPLAFTADPARGIDYPSIIVEVSPAEYEDIQNGKLQFGDFPRKRAGELRRKRSVIVSPKKRRDLASKGATEQDQAKNCYYWTLGEELLPRRGRNDNAIEK
jgi:hypothetical protein